MVVNVYFPDNADLLDWRAREIQADTVKPWKPEALGRDQWPPNYTAVYAWRIKTLAQLRADKTALASAKAYYKTRPAEFIMHWMDTYDPRKAGNKWMPFVFFNKQYDFITFLHELRTDGESGLVEKSRDVGATWGACGYSIFSWLFIKDDAIGWGSRKQDLVDTIGDPDSIFEKLRLIIKRLPDIWLPEGLKPKEHITFMKLINPATGSVITGEAGDNIGRGGRKTMYFKDESAHYERPDKIEAALGDNTNVQVDISSVNGLGNVFHRRREAGIDWRSGHKIEPGFTRVFVVDWRDHPNKTQEWYDTRKAKYEREGLAHLFAQEVDRNYSAAISNTIIPYEWIVAAVDAHIKIPYLAAHIAKNGIPNIWSAGLDVADEGIDRNALAKRQWIIWRTVEEWGERDVGVSTRRAVAACRQHRGVKVQYDCVGLGASVKAEFNRLVDEKIITPEEIKLVAWNAGAHVQNPFERIIPDDDESPINKDVFQNMKAQAWLSISRRFYKTFKAVTEGIIYPVDDLISLDSSMNLLHQLMKELAQSTSSPGSSLKTVVNKKPDGMKSPNLADAGIQMFFPVQDDYGQILIGSMR
jgi:phage terminase large subunit